MKRGEGITGEFPPQIHHQVTAELEIGFFYFRFFISKDKQLAAVMQRLRADCRGLCAFYLWHHRAGISFQFGKLVLLLVEQSGRESARTCSRTRHRLSPRPD